MPPVLSTLHLPDYILASPIRSILFPIIIGTTIGGLTQRLGSTKHTYRSLRQPPGAPPAWVFGPVWTVLYGMMGYASHRAFTSTPHDPYRGQGLYLAQLLLNFSWMPLFFGVNQPKIAMGVLVGLEGVLLKLWGTWGGTESARLLLPYILWTGFAGYLNAGVGLLNGWNLWGSGKGAKEN